MAPCRNSAGGPLIPRDGTASLRAASDFHAHWYRDRKSTFQPLLDPLWAGRQRNTANLQGHHTGRIPSTGEELRVKQPPVCSACHIRGHTRSSRNCPLKLQASIASQSRILLDLEVAGGQTLAPAVRLNGSWMWSAMAPPGGHDPRFSRADGGESFISSLEVLENAAQLLWKSDLDIPTSPTHFRQHIKTASSRFEKHTLDLCDEIHLADNIAFLASNVTDKYATAVSSAMIKEKNGSLVIWLTQNEQPEKATKDALLGVLLILHETAQTKGQGSVVTGQADEQIQKLFRYAVRHCSTKITCRARVVNRSGNLCSVARRWRHGIKKSHKLCDISRRLSDLVHALEEVENTARPDNDHLEAIVKAAYELCYFKRWYHPLEKRLSYCGAIRPHGDGCDDESLHILQVEKLALYYALSRDLIFLSSEYGKVFENIQLEIVDIREQMLGRRVHAEIQAIHHFESSLEEGSLPPRVLGLSKSCCFLCYLFIEKHGKFHSKVTRAHNRLYIDNWGIPPGAERGWGLIFEEMAQYITSITGHGTRRRGRKRLPFSRWPVESRAGSPICELYLQR